MKVSLRGIRRFSAACGTMLIVGAIAGCGTNLAATLTLDDARAECLAGNNDPGEFTSIVLLAEATRDSGQTELGFLISFSPACEDVPFPDGCSRCLTAIAAVVWN